VIRTIVRTVIGVVVLTVAFGVVYPVVMTGFAQLAFSDKANGSLIKVNGRVVGSKLAGQEFTKPQYFHGRLSATVPAYNAAGTTFSNLGPTSPELRDQVKTQIAAIMKLEGPYNPGLSVGAIPVDAVTTSGSGIDPDITPAYAHLQARRIAAVRGIPLGTVEQLISHHTDGRSLGFLGEPGVNVLELNLALDQLKGQQ
jgi:potassium-transporting ATPase KdpC subunit